MYGFLVTGGTEIDFTPITNALSSSFSVAQIAAIVGIVIAAGVGLAVMWFGARKITRAVIGAFKTGKISF